MRHRQRLRNDVFWWIFVFILNLFFLIFVAAAQSHLDTWRTDSRIYTHFNGIVFTYAAFIDWITTHWKWKSTKRWLIWFEMKKKSETKINLKMSKLFHSIRHFMKWFLFCFGAEGKKTKLISSNFFSGFPFFVFFLFLT